MQPGDISVDRYLRTASSEAYNVFLRRPDGTYSRLAAVDVHFHERAIFATLVLLEKYPKRALESLLKMLDDQIGQIGVNREDFITTVYQGKQRAYYSDVLSEDDFLDRPATVRDVATLSRPLNQIMTGHQQARGHLAEHAVVDFFKAIGCEAERAGPELDQRKVDVVAYRGQDIIYAQVKLGKATFGQLHEFVKAVAAIRNERQVKSVAAFVAQSFPPETELRKMDLEREFGFPILTIDQGQILSVAREYRRVLAK